MAQTNRELPRLGAKVRALRRRESLSQVQMAERLGISPSYLNLIESNRRPLPAALLIKLAQGFGINLPSFGGEEDGRVISDLLEAFSDPAFDTYQLASTDLRDLAINHPQVARAVLALYRSYKTQRVASDELASRLDGEEQGNIERSQLPTEEVNDLIQAHRNYFPELRKGPKSCGARASSSPRSSTRAWCATSKSTTACRCGSRAGGPSATSCGGSSRTASCSR